jgi:hypothetical protein
METQQCLTIPMVQLVYPPHKCEPQALYNCWSFGTKIFRLEVPLNGITCLPNFEKIYHLVQKLFIDLLYLKPAMPLGHFCSTMNYRLRFPWLRHCLCVVFIQLHKNESRFIKSLSASLALITFVPTGRFFIKFGRQVMTFKGTSMRWLFIP